MSNSLLTISQITRKAAMVLHQKSVFINSINRQYDSSFGQDGAKIGDTLRVRMPNQYTARSGMTMAAQNTTESKVDLPVTSVKGVDMQFTSTDLALHLDDFSERIIDPAMSVLAAAIEDDVRTNLYKTVYNLVDGDTVAFGLTHLSQARQILTDNLAPPSKRTAILETGHTTKFLNDTKSLTQSASAIAEQYEDGTIGTTSGLIVKESTLFLPHTTGTAVKGDTLYNVAGANQTGSALTVDTGATTFLKGDVITLAGCYRVHPETKVSTGVLQNFVITADTSTSATTLNISPAIVVTGPTQNVSASPTNAGAVTKLGAGNGETLGGSMAFYRDAFTFATADLPLPKGEDMASRALVDNISVSLIRGFNISDRTFPCRLDVLYGYAALRPQLATRIHADG